MPCSPCSHPDVSINYALQPKEQRNAPAPIVCAEGVPLEDPSERIRKECQDSHPMFLVRLESAS